MMGWVHTYLTQPSTRPPKRSSEPLTESGGYLKIVRGPIFKSGVPLNEGRPTESDHGISQIQAKHGAGYQVEFAYAAKIERELGLAICQGA